MRHNRPPDFGSKERRVGYNAGGAVMPPKRTGYYYGGDVNPYLMMGQLQGMSQSHQGSMPQFVSPGSPQQQQGPTFPAPRNVAGINALTAMAPNPWFIPFENSNQNTFSLPPRAAPAVEYPAYRDVNLDSLRAKGREDMAHYSDAARDRFVAGTASKGPPPAYELPPLPSSAPSKGFAQGGMVGGSGVETDPKGTATHFDGVRISQASGQTPYEGGATELKMQERSRVGVKPPKRTGYAQGGEVGGPDTFVTGDTLAGQVQERFNQALQVDDKGRRNYDDGGEVVEETSGGGGGSEEAAAEEERRRAEEEAARQREAEAAAEADRLAQAQAAADIGNSVVSEPSTQDVQDNRPPPEQAGDTGATDLGPGTPMGEQAFPSTPEPAAAAADPNAVGIEGDPSQGQTEQIQEQTDRWLKNVLDYTHAQFIDPSQQNQVPPDSTGYAQSRPDEAPFPTNGAGPQPAVQTGYAPEQDIGATAAGMSVGPQDVQRDPNVPISPTEGLGAMAGEGLRRAGRGIANTISDAFTIDPVAQEQRLYEQGSPQQTFADMLRGDRGYSGEQMLQMLEFASERQLQLCSPADHGCV